MVFYFIYYKNRTHAKPNRPI